MSPPAARIDWLDAQDLLDELCEDQLTVSMNLARLERAAEDAPRDPSARAALAALEARVADLVALSGALADLQGIAADARTHPLFLADAPLADYLRGIYAWMHAVVRALDVIATSLHSLTPDWATFRWRIEEAKHFHFDELHGAIRAELEAMAVGLRSGRGSLPPFPSPRGAPRPLSRAELLGDLASAVGRLFLAAENLEASLDRRFG